MADVTWPQGISKHRPPCVRQRHRTALRYRTASAVQTQHEHCVLSLFLSPFCSALIAEVHKTFLFKPDFKSRPSWRTSNEVPHAGQAWPESRPLGSMTAPPCPSWGTGYFNGRFPSRSPMNLHALTCRLQQATMTCLCVLEAGTLPSHLVTFPTPASSCLYYTPTQISFLRNTRRRVHLLPIHHSAPPFLLGRSQPPSSR